MKDEDAPTTTISIPLSSTTTSTSTIAKRESSVAGVFGKTGYKVWVLAAVLLLAFWSMFTGSVTLKWSSSNSLTSPFSDDIDFPVHDDLDILELGDREKVVRRMWDVYTQSSGIRLPKFWLQAFEAAYEYLVSDLPGVRDAAISEIAKLSMRSIKLDPPPRQSTVKHRI